MASMRELNAQYLSWNLSWTENEKSKSMTKAAKADNLLERRVPNVSQYFCSNAQLSTITVLWNRIHNEEKKQKLEQ